MGYEKPENLETLLERSHSSETFKEAARRLETGEVSDSVQFNNGSPHVKILRVIKHLLGIYPELRVESVKIDGRSGCSDFKGVLVVRPGDRRFAFEWDCYWKARELGWDNFFGNPDQTRAAQTFDYLCFRKFEEIFSSE